MRSARLSLPQKTTLLTVAVFRQCGDNSVGAKQIGNTLMCVKMLQVVRAKSTKAGRAPVQPHWRPPSPSTQHLQQQREREMSLRGGGQLQQHSTPGSRIRSPQPPSSPLAAEQLLHGAQHWGSRMFQEESCEAYHDRQPHTAGVDRMVVRSRGSADGAAAAATGWGLGDGTCLCTHAKQEEVFSPGKGFAEATTVISPANGGQWAHGTNLKHSRSAEVQHTNKQGGSSRLEPPIISDRLTLTQPYVFRWGGRITSRHRAFSEMHSSSNAAATDWTISAARPSTSLKSSYPAGNAFQQQRQQQLRQQQRSKQQGNSVNLPMAAAAAELGARAEKLMKLLEMRVPRKHSKSGKQRPVSGRIQQLQQPDANNLYSDELVYELEDDPISVPQDYLRL